VSETLISARRTGTRVASNMGRIGTERPESIPALPGKQGLDEQGGPWPTDASTKRRWAKATL